MDPKILFFLLSILSIVWATSPTKNAQQEKRRITKSKEKEKFKPSEQSAFQKFQSPKSIGKKAEKEQKDDKPIDQQLQLAADPMEISTGTAPAVAIETESRSGQTPSGGTASTKRKSGEQSPLLEGSAEVGRSSETTMSDKGNAEEKNEIETPSKKRRVGKKLATTGGSSSAERPKTVPSISIDRSINSGSFKNAEQGPPSLSSTSQNSQQFLERQLTEHKEKINKLQEQMQQMMQIQQQQQLPQPQQPQQQQLLQSQIPQQLPLVHQQPVLTQHQVSHLVPQQSIPFVPIAVLNSGPTNVASDSQNVSMQLALSDQNAEQHQLIVQILQGIDPHSRHEIYQQMSQGISITRALENYFEQQKQQRVQQQQIPSASSSRRLPTAAVPLQQILGKGVSQQQRQQQIPSASTLGRLPIPADQLQQLLSMGFMQHQQQPLSQMHNSQQVLFMLSPTKTATAALPKQSSQQPMVGMSQQSLPQQQQQPVASAASAGQFPVGENIQRMEHQQRLASLTVPGSSKGFGQFSPVNLQTLQQYANAQKSVAATQPTNQPTGSAAVTSAWSSDRQQKQTNAKEKAKQKATTPIDNQLINSKTTEGNIYGAVIMSLGVLKMSVEQCGFSKPAKDIDYFSLNVDHTIQLVNTIGVIKGYHIITPAFILDQIQTGLLYNRIGGTVKEIIEEIGEEIGKYKNFKSGTAANQQNASETSVLLTFGRIYHKLFKLLNLTNEKDGRSSKFQNLQKWTEKMDNEIRQKLENSETKLSKEQQWCTNLFRFEDTVWSAKLAVLVVFPPNSLNAWIENGGKWNKLNEMMSRPKLNELLAYYNDSTSNGLNFIDEIHKYMENEQNIVFSKSEAKLLIDLINQIDASETGKNSNTMHTKMFNLVKSLAIFRQLIAQFRNGNNNEVIGLTKLRSEMENALQFLELCVMLLDAKFDTFKSKALDRIEELDRIRKGHFLDEGQI